MTETHKIKRYITVPFQKEGTHFYPGADIDPKLATGSWDDVGHLGHNHFHYFFFKVTIEVFENNRDIEFIQFSRYCQRKYTSGSLTLDHRSCEMIAEELILEIAKDYAGREITIEVYEDNINGARLVYTP